MEFSGTLDVDYSPDMLAFTFLFQAARVPPALVVLSHCPEGATQNIAWVGKGIVYDTGGLSIKSRVSFHPLFFVIGDPCLNGEGLPRGRKKINPAQIWPT